MQTVPSRYSEMTYGLLRFVLGALFACHGAQKLFGAFGAETATRPLLVAGGVIEFFGGLLIAAGFLTRAASFLSSGMMAVAYFMAHAAKGFWPIVNKGETAVMYCFAFLFIAANGGGFYSLDRLLHRPVPKPALPRPVRNVTAA
jgi:putative oxidoreductase